MSSIEERLARDIEAVTGGVVVSQTDVEQAREQVEEQIARSGRQRQRRTAVALLAAAAVAAAVVGVVLTGGPGDEPDSAPADSTSKADESFLIGDDPTVETVRGVWRVDNGVTLVRFTDDGAIAVDTRGQITNAELAGTYTIEGDEIVVDLGDVGEPGCTGEVVFRASVRTPDEMRMLAEPVVADCAFEQSGRWVLEHMLPTRPEYTRFGPPTNGDFGALRQDVLPGFWLVVGGGYGLQLTEGNTYYALDEAGQEVDLGLWWLEGNDLVLESERGCRLGISDVQHINPGTDMIRGTVTESVCEMPWVAGDGGSTMEWFQVPDRTSR